MNPRPSEHESPPKATRPGLPPSGINLLEREVAREAVISDDKIEADEVAGSSAEDVVLDRRQRELEAVGARDKEGLFTAHEEVAASVAKTKNGQKYI